MRLRNTLLLVLLCMFFGSVSAQKKIVGKPEKYNAPKDYFDKGSEKLLEKFLTSRDKKSKNTPWFVVSDRDDNVVYDKPGGKEVARINFKDWFYVTEENNEWVHIVTAKRKGLKIDKLVKDIGWIRKENVLLWSNSLLDPNTQIHRKVFLLNKVSDIDRILQSDNKEIVKIHKGPKTGATAEKKNIYEFYFVYKRENGRILIGKESRFGTPTIKDVLIGWIREAKASQWNTRIALEPNYTAEAFEERNSDKEKRVIGWQDSGGAIAFSSTGKINKNKVLWDNDPVTRTPVELASDGRRFRGDVVRFPMLSNRGDYFYSGAIGEVTTKSVKDVFKIDELNWAAMTEEVQDNDKRREYFNIMFMVEGTRSMADYKTAIINAMDNVTTGFPDFVKIKYGVAVYRDTEVSDPSKLLELFPLNADKAKAINFLNKVEFDSYGDVEEYTSSRYALLQTLIKGGFSPDESNILITIGNYGDYIYNPRRAAAAEAASDKTFVNREDYLDQLDKLDMHMVSFQCKNDRTKANQKYGDLMKSIISESATRQYKEYSKLKEYYPDFQIGNPYMPDIDEGDDLRVENGPSVGRLLKPQVNSALSGKVLQETIISSCKEVFDQVESSRDKMKNLTQNGRALDQSTGGWSPAIAREIYRMLNKSKKGKGFSENDLKKLVHEKYHLYREIYIVKKPKGAKNSALSYVLFMPREDLDSYVSTLNNLVLTKDESPDRQREALMSTFTELLKQFTGNDDLRKKDVEKTDLNQLSSIMQGVEDEGLEMNKGLNFKIGDIMNSRKLSDEDLGTFIESISKKYARLKEIQSAGRTYEFSYVTSNNEYYWIPVEYAL